MPPKRQKPNAFVMFASEFQKQGHTFKEAIDKAGPVWARMNKTQRRPYEEKAKSTCRSGTKYTSEGLPVDTLLRNANKETAYLESEKEDIRTLITFAQQTGDLELLPFHFIHFNMHCYYPPTDTYYPAELGLCRLTLLNGVTEENAIHNIIYPGQLPLGYSFEAKQLSEKTHELKIPYEMDAKDNQLESYLELKSFLNVQSPNRNETPILFTKQELVKMVRNILNKWSNDYDGIEELFKVYSVEMLLHFLKNCVYDGPEQWPSYAFSGREVDKDVYAYSLDLGCEYHQTSGNSVYCSRSIVMRYAYGICDNCCAGLNIQLKAGFHVPSDAAVPESKDSRSHRVRTSQYVEDNKCFSNAFNELSVSDTGENESSSNQRDSPSDDFILVGRTKRSSAQHYAAATNPLSASDIKGVGISAETGVRPTFKGRGIRRPADIPVLSTETGVLPSFKGRGIRRTAAQVINSSGPAPATDPNQFPPLGRGFHKKL